MVPSKVPPKSEKDFDYHDDGVTFVFTPYGLNGVWTFKCDATLDGVKFNYTVSITAIGKMNDFRMIQLPIMKATIGGIACLTPWTLYFTVYIWLALYNYVVSCPLCGLTITKANIGGIAYQRV